MSPEQLFPVLNMVSLVSWLLLAIVPRRPLVTRTIAGAAVPAFFAVAYIAIARLARVGQADRQQLVQEHTERVHVGSDSERLAENLFRRRVVRSECSRAELCERAVVSRIVVQ